MCGIVAYLGYREVIEILLRGLQRLEYRFACVYVKFLLIHAIYKRKSCIAAGQ